MNNQKHYAAAIAAFVIWGFFSIPLRALSGYSPGEILFFRIVFSLLVLICVLPFRSASRHNDKETFRALSYPEKKTTVALTLVGGMLLSVNWLTFIYIVNHINIKTASFSYMICPVITAVLGYFLIRERMTPMQWIAVALCALSCVLVGLSSALELGFSFLTAFTYALYLITQRRNQGFDRLNVLTIQVLSSLIILSFFSPVLVEEIPGDFRFYALITVIAVCFTVLPLFLNLFALNRINSATIGILMYLNPLINFTVAFVVFAEQVTAFQIAGYAIIAIALVLFNIQNIRRLHAALSTQN